jgi:hypothetical protein
MLDARYMHRPLANEPRAKGRSMRAAQPIAIQALW